ncbi:MAG: CsbD family protein [Bacteriovorax sp.]
MKINENTTKGKWREIKGDVQKAWGKLTDDDLDKSEGDMKKIAGIIQQRYGETQKGASEKLADIFKRHEKS